VKKEEKPDIEILLSVDAYIPDVYIPDGYQKIQMYKRIKAMDHVEEYSEIMEELADRFGDLPIETERLLRIARMKVWGLDAGVLSVKEKQKIVTLLLSAEGTARVDGGKIVEESMKFERAVGFGMDGMQLKFTIDERKCGKYQPFDILEEMMQIIANAKKQQ